jgi:hypothetical protein
VIFYYFFNKITMTINIALFGYSKLPFKYEIGK